MPDKMEILGSMVSKIQAQDNDARAKLVNAVKSARNATPEYISALADIMNDYGNLHTLSDREQAVKTIENVHKRLTSIEEANQTAIAKAVAKATRAKTDAKAADETGTDHAEQAPLEPAASGNPPGYAAT